MLNLTDRKPLDESIADHQEFLADLQCNIVSSHNRPNTHYFFVRFRDREMAVAALVALARGTFHKGLELESELRSRARRHAARAKSRPEKARASWAAQTLGRGSAEFSTNLLLTAGCYREFLNGLVVPPDAAFGQGMTKRAARLYDAPLRGAGFEAHALYMVGYDEKVARWQAVRESIVDGLEKLGVLVREQPGFVLRHAEKGYPIEPFGYRDAISQPLFYESDLELRRHAQGAAVVGSGSRFTALAPLSTVLVADPNGASKQPCGTYFVYRKIEQKVGFFYKQAADLAQQLPRSPDGIAASRDDVADRLIGRHVDGRPLDPAPSLNEFVYPDQSACPMHAHVRKVNPRDNYALDHRIVRRATVFGPKIKREESGRPMFMDGAPVRLDDGKIAKDAVGLMFLCCQADITNQFEVIQSTWANRVHGGADTVIGQLPAGTQNKLGFNGSGPKYVYEPVVEVLEGAYFFAPSLSFFSSKF
jgi:Dyp-type peroxidase family